MDVALAATACNRDEVNAELAGSVVFGRSGGGVRTPLDALPLNMASIVGRKAAPNGVDRKSDGKSAEYFENVFSRRR